MTNQNLSRILGPQYEIVPFGIEVGTGPSGSVSGTLDVTITAQEDLEVYRAVGYDGRYTQPDANSLVIYAGITRIAAIMNDPINVVRSGLMTENTWTWTPNAPIFIELNGTLTQTEPLAGNPIRRIGWAISVTELILDPHPIIGVQQMPDKYLQHDTAGGFKEVTATSIGGVEQADKIPALDLSGRLNPTMLPTDWDLLNHTVLNHAILNIETHAITASEQLVQRLMIHDLQATT